MMKVVNVGSINMLLDVSNFLTVPPTY